MTHDEAKALGCACDQCPLQKLGRGPVPPKPAYGRTHPLLVIVCEEPGFTEVKRGEPLIGASGYVVTQFFKDRGIARGRLHLTNALLCGGQKTLTGKERTKALDCCRPRLVREMHQISDKAPVLAMGELALTTLTGRKGIHKWRGFPLESQVLGRPVHPTYHPAFLFRSPAYFPVWALDIDRVLESAEPAREPAICVSEDPDEQLAALGTIALDDTPALDIESADRRDPLLTELSHIGLASLDQAVSIKTYGMAARVHDRLEELFLDGVHVKVLQNQNYDLTVLGRFGFPQIAPTYDILLAARIRFPSIAHDLGSLATYFNYFRRWKEEFAAGESEKAYYNALDCWQTRTVYEQLCSLFANDAQEEEEEGIRI